MANTYGRGRAALLTLGVMIDGTLATFALAQNADPLVPNHPWHGRLPRIWPIQPMIRGFLSRKPPA